MSIDRLQTELGWPSPEEIWTPSGMGSRVFAALADRKIGGALRRFEASSDIRVGILAPAPAESSSQQPLAIVCEFQSAATVELLREAHRLAWNFSRAPLLITLEPHLVRAWSCCEPPSAEPSLHTPAAEIPEAQVDLRSLSARAAQSLHWLELVTGRFFRRHEDRFRRDRCADRLLLDNLKHVRQRLLRQNLSDDTSHDLLARLIFIQFLFDRRDSSGKAALNAAKLHGLYKDGVLAASHDTLASVLSDYNDAYAFFRWLDTIFNGDLFPGKGNTAAEREAEWEREMNEVKPQHLGTIAEFVGGQVMIRLRQRLLWQEYSFDAIPLEFISSIYEEFVTKRGKKKSGTVYTPPHVVDFVLDQVLPWDSQKWDVRILDPACGSGVFLVKAFQRLIHRWRLAHAGEDPRVADLRLLLERNLFGVDNDPHAVRVASFSLYLAMCDEIDPKHYWSQVRFPRMRGRTLVCSDFFAEDTEGFRTEQDAGTFDIVVGNAPWGSGTVGSSNVSRWEKAGWPVVYNSIGPLFLAKGMALLKAGGRLSMLQAAGLLLNEVGTAQKFRQRLFASVSVEAVVNLSTLRFELFPNAVGPACIITFCNEAANSDQFVYICPKSATPTEDDYRITVDPHDVLLLRCADVLQDPISWTALMWGGPRDVALIKKLERRSALRDLPSRGGIILGDRGRKQIELLGRRIIDVPNFPQGTWLRLNARNLPKNTSPWTHSADSTDLTAFDLPQLLIKQRWTIRAGRFEAAIVDSTPRIGGVLCSRDYITVHAPDGNVNLLEAACLTCNSILAVYFLLLVSHRLASYRPNPNKSDWLRIPVPEPFAGILDGLTSWDDVDQRVFDCFNLTPTERALIEDAVNVTLADFKGDASSPGRRSTRYPKGSEGLSAEPVLTKYCEQFIAVLQAAFGEDKQIRATVFQEGAGGELPVRLVAFHLNWPGAGGIARETMDAGGLLDRLRTIGERLDVHRSGTGFQRIARFYDAVTVERRVIPTVYLIKPDCVRYWTRAAALRDADEVFADFLLWSEPESAVRESESYLA